MEKKFIFILACVFLFSGCSGTTGYEYLVDNYELMNTSMPAVNEIQITGKGVGASETTTGTIDNIIYEGFAVSDILYSSWIIPSTIDYEIPAYITMKFFVATQEVDPTMKFKFMYTIFDGNTFVNVSSSEFTTGDIEITTAPLEYFELKLLLNESLIMTCTENCVFSVTLERVASSNDYSGEVNLFSLMAEYNDFRPTMETSSLTVYNTTYLNQTTNNIFYNGSSTSFWYGNETDIYANATKVHIGSYVLYDNGTDFIFEEII